MNKEQKLIRLSQRLRKNPDRASQIYTEYLKLTDNSTVNHDFRDDYGVAINNVYNDCSLSTHEALQAISRLKQLAYRSSLTSLNKDILKDSGQKYYYFRKYPENSDHDGAEEFKNMTEDQKIKAGREYNLIQARNIQNSLKVIHKHGYDYFLVLNYKIGRPYEDEKFSKALTYDDINFTINNALNQEIIERLNRQNAINPLLTPREAQAVIENRYQKVMVDLNWNNYFGNYRWDNLDFSKEVLYPAGTKKLDVRSAQNAYRLMDYLLATDRPINLKKLTKAKIDKSDIKKIKING